MTSINVTRIKAEKAVITAISQTSMATDMPMSEFLVSARLKGTAKFEALVDQAFEKLQATHS